MEWTLLYIPFVAGLALLVALLLIRLKRIQRNFPVAVWLTAAVVATQVFSGLFLIIQPLTDLPGLGIVLILMAVTVVVATLAVYSSLRTFRKPIGEDPTVKIEAMTKDYNGVLTHTTDIIERERLKHQIDKLKDDLHNHA